MNRLGVIARCDQGGLASQTVEFATHMNVDLALVIRMGDGSRGVEDMCRFGCETVVNEGPRLHEDVLREVMTKVDVLYTIEGPYAPDLFDWCEHYDVKLVMHANPELWRGWMCHELIVPTTWKADELGAKVLPFPVCTDRLHPSPRKETPTFVHVLGPAMADRQGTQLLEAALGQIEHECTFLMRCDDPGEPQRHGVVTVWWLPRTHHYWDSIPDGCWALVQPRRYGGLSLPIQEAAARGLTTISLDRDPESTFYRDVTVRVEAVDAVQYPMAGGYIDVWECNPWKLARTVDQYIEDGSWTQPRHWALDHSWAALKPRYDELLR